MQGLQNLGSTCAVNSLIQIICREPTLRDTLINYALPENTLSGNLKEILVMMHKENKSLIPGKFITKLFESMQNIFIHGEQLDIGELWTFLFDKISMELNTIPGAYEVLSPLSSDKKEDIDIGLEYKNDIEYKRALINNKALYNKYENEQRKFNGNKTTKWLTSCQGFFLNIIRCQECKNVLYNFEPFTTISLDIPDDIECPTITQMIRKFLKEESIKDEWKCSKCNKNTEYIKTIKLWKIPPVLVFIIKRFSDYSSKNAKPIDINKTICFKNGSNLSNLDNDVSYLISSIGMHYGSLQGGHYCAMCNTEEDMKLRYKQEKIVFYDDLNISTVSKEQYQKIIEKNVDGYMIVYSIKE
jgi:ubiquitin C-terminal hydrolase